MNKKKILGTLLDYFVKKGEVMDYKTYRAALDKPIRLILVKRVITSWARLPYILERNFPEKFALIGKPIAKPVVKGVKDEK